MVFILVDKGTFLMHYYRSLDCQILLLFSLLLSYCKYLAIAFVVGGRAAGVESFVGAIYFSFGLPTTLLAKLALSCLRPLQCFPENLGTMSIVISSVDMTQ